MKQHIKINLHNEGSPTLMNTLTQIVGANNGEKSLFNIYDVIAAIKLKMLEYPSTLKDIKYEVLENKIFISDLRENENVYFCTLEWVELHELNVNEIPGDDLYFSQSEKDAIFERIADNLELLDQEQQEEALKQCKAILDESGNNRMLEGDGDE